MRKTTNSKQQHSAKSDAKPGNIRRTRWEFNRRLLVLTFGLVSTAMLFLGAAYWYQSRNITTSILARADQAALAGKWEAQLAWLKQLKILQPENLTVTIDIAEAADRAVDLPPANRLDRVERAKNLTSEAIATLREFKSKDHQKEQTALIRKLIQRELQFGQLYATSIRRQVLDLNAESADNDLLRAFALSKHALSLTKTAEINEPPKITFEQDQNYWLWLDQQTLPEILATAWRANLNSTELAAYLADACLRTPESFPDPAVEKSEAVKQELIRQLSQMPTDGHAQLILLSLQHSDSNETALAFLEKQSQPALKRLLKISSEAGLNDDPSQDPESANAIPILPPTKLSEVYQPNWDFSLVLEWAKLRLGNDTPTPPAVLESLDQLLSINLSTLQPNLIETAYLLRAVDDTGSDSGEADAILLDGIDRLGVNSLRLNLVRATRLSNSGEVAVASVAVYDLEKTIRSKRALLSGQESRRFSREQRAANESALDNAKWVASLLRGKLATRQGNFVDAVNILGRSLETQVSIPGQQRLKAAVLLADVHSQMEDWDLAATTYETAASLAPNPDQFRVRAAKAWASAGNAMRSFEQWRSIDGNSLSLKLMQLRARTAEELAQPPATRNYTTIWSRIDSLRTALHQQRDSLQTEEFSLLESELELLTLAVPDRDNGGQRATAVERLFNLSTTSTENADLQQFAAISLAQVGRIDDAMTALNRLRDLVGQESFSFIISKAKIEAATGDVESATATLLNHASNHPKDSLEATLLAAEYVAATSDLKRAQQLLLAIPLKLHKPESAFRMFSYALANLNPATGDDAQFVELIDREKKIRDIEGESGTWWKLAKAIRLLIQSATPGLDPGEKVDLIAEASELNVEIHNARPRWALGLTLNGQVAAARGELIAAIQSLKSGISNGDTRLSTAYLLTKLLLQTNRVVEAESEYSRFERLRQANSSVAAFAISIADKKGDYAQGLDLARQTTETIRSDENSWLLLAQAATTAARFTDEQLAKDALLAEARKALDIAIEMSGNSSVTAYTMRLRFQAEFFGRDSVRTELVKLSESKVAEPTRSLLVGYTYLQIPDTAASLKFFEQAANHSPNSSNVYVGLAAYYQFVGNDPKNVEMLERAFQLAPNQIEIRNRLAIAISLRSGSDIPWSRLKSLLDTDLSESTPNKLLHALILINRGGEQQQDQAEQILIDLTKYGDPKADDARRMLASLYRKRWIAANALQENSPDAQRWLSQARGIYLTLINRQNPRPLDIYRMGDLLLLAKQTQEVNPLADRLDATTQGSPIALDLRLRLAKQAGNSKKVAELTQAWADRALEDDGPLQVSIWETAGQLLSKLGYHNESITWLEQAYKADPSKFRIYIRGLTRAQRFDKAINVCMARYSSEASAEVVAVMADVAVLMRLGVLSVTVPKEIEAVFKSALQKYDSEPNLIEAIATMRLAQERYPEAIALYERALSFSPNNVRLLNNLAMALSEVPGREPDAIQHARKAILIFGRSPELLDTLGLVQLRNGNIAEAEKILREATDANPDPRYRFHLLMAILRKGDKKESITQWSQLDLSSLRKAALTPAERRDLTEISKKFETGT